MDNRRMVILLATALIVLTAGCATQQPGAVASLTESDVARSSIGGLNGTWRGWFVQTGSDGHMDGDLTLIINEDATYKLITRRRGRGDVTGGVDSGVVVANGRSVTLSSSSGQSTQLVRKGDTLYGVTKALSGHTIQISLERTPGVPAETP